MEGRLPAVERLEVEEREWAVAEVVVTAEASVVADSWVERERADSEVRPLRLEVAWEDLLGFVGLVDLRE